MPPTPSDSRANRYQRQIVLPEIGEEGQERLSKARVLCIGAGGLGSSALQYLVAGGVGHIGIVDGDRVDEGNLQRQVLFRTADRGLNKAEVGRERLLELNPYVDIEAMSYALNVENARSLFENYDLVLDGTDNFSAKYLINDAAMFCDIPVVFGSVLRFEGQVAIFWASKGPCYRCLFPEPPKDYVPNCAEAGILGALPGIIGSMQALEAMKLILQSAHLLPLIGRFLTFDASRMSWKSFEISKNEDCLLCSQTPQITSLFEYSGFCQSADPDLEVLVSELPNPASLLMVDVREALELESGSIPGALHFPLSKLSAGDLPEIGKEEKIILYCQSGIRSQRALEILRSKGYAQARHLKGGILAWKARRTI